MGWWGDTIGSRVQLWQDEDALWGEAVRVAQDKPRPWINLARREALAGDLERADAHTAMALILATRRPAPERRAADYVARVNQARWRVDFVAWLTDSSSP